MKGEIIVAIMATILLINVLASQAVIVLTCNKSTVMKNGEIGPEGLTVTLEENQAGF